MIIVLCYLMVYGLAMYILYRQNLLSVTLGITVTLSWLATLVAAYYSFLIQVGDPAFYFNSPDNHFGVISQHQFTVWFAQTLIKPLARGDYFLTYLGFACFGFIGRVLSVLFFYHVCQTHQSEIAQKRAFFFGPGQWVCALLLLWPTLVFWGSLLGKDSLQYCFIFLLLYSLVAESIPNVGRVIMGVVSISMLILIRPYNSALMTIAICCMMLIGNFRLSNRLLGLGVILVLGAIAWHVMYNAYTINLLNLNWVMKYGLVQQMKQHHGTAITMHLSTSMDYWLNLPWTFFANAFLPLPGWYTTNLHAWLTAILNCIFVYIAATGLLWFVFKRPKLLALYYFNYLMLMLGWCFAGFLLLAAVNTNLGLADRQKIPYVAMFILFYGAIQFIKWLQQHKATIDVE